MKEFWQNLSEEFSIDSNDGPRYLLYILPKKPKKGLFFFVFFNRSVINQSWNMQSIKFLFHLPRKKDQRNWMEKEIQKYCLNFLLREISLEEFHLTRWENIVTHDFLTIHSFNNLVEIYQFIREWDFLFQLWSTKFTFEYLSANQGTTICPR